MRNRRFGSILLLSAILLALPLLSGCGHYASVGYTRSGPVTGVAYVDVAPPPMRVEYYGSAPRADYVWMSGHWAWSGTRYTWVEGYWAARPSSYARWVPGRWNASGNRYYWVDGRWQ